MPYNTLIYNVNRHWIWRNGIVFIYKEKYPEYLKGKSLQTIIISIENQM